MKNKVLTLFFLITSFVAFSQEEIAVQNFDDQNSWQFTAFPESYNIGDKDIWEATASLSSNNSLDTPVSGALFWGMRDLDNPYISDSIINGGLQLENPLEHTLTFENISVSGKNDVKVSFSYNAYSLGTTGYLSVEVFVDDASLGKESVFNGTDDGSETVGWQEYSKLIDNGSSNVRLTIYAYNDQDYLAVDNFLIEAGAQPSCEFSFGEQSATCDAVTEGTDTYTASIGYIGGTTGTFTVSSTSGQIGGDDPNAVAEGTIVVSGITEGEDITVTVQSDICDASIVIESPTCYPPVSLPFEEGFDYEVGSKLVDDANWEVDGTSDDDIVIVDEQLTYNGLIPLEGKAATFDGGGNNAVLRIQEITAGELFVSLVFKITNMDGFTDGGYFAVLGDYNSRLYVKPGPTADKFVIGFGNTNKIADVEFNEVEYDLDQNIFVVINLDITTGNSSLWINPGSTTFSSEDAPEATMTFLAGYMTLINQFILRQDSESETPTFVIDELRLGTSWAEVTPKSETNALSNKNSLGIRVFPNPVSSGIIQIETEQDDPVELEIFSIDGKLVFTDKIQNNQTISISSLGKGTYIAKVVSANKSGIAKLIVE